MKDRREFLKIMGALGAALIWPINMLKAEVKKIAFTLDKAKKLKKVDGWAILQIKERPILFVRDTEKTVRALDSQCTHKRCTVEYNATTKKIVCPCHGSVFNHDGSVAGPPAKKALRSYPVEMGGEKVIITIDE